MPSEGSQFEYRTKQGLSWLFSAFPSKHEIEPQIRLVPLPSTWFSIHYFSIHYETTIILAFLSCSK